jgi:hypothetical protein
VPEVKIQYMLIVHAVLLKEVRREGVREGGQEKISPKKEISEESQVWGRG